jgi:hypothetical protein
MLPRNSESVQRRSVSGFAACFYVELSADTPDEFCLAAFRRKHPGQKKQIACLHCFRIGTEWLGRCWKLDAKFL